MKPHSSPSNAPILKVMVAAAVVWCAVECTMLAQVAVTAEPAFVDASHPSSIKIRAENAAVGDQLNAVDHATVEGARIPVQVSNGAVALTPPPLAAGVKTIRLLNASDGVIAEAHVEYRTGGGSRSAVALSVWFYALVTMLFAATVVPFAVAILTSTWRGPEAQNPQAPLGLPVGTVRAILAFSLVLYLGLYVLANVFGLSEFRPPDFLTGIVATVIGFYFGSRNDTAAASTAIPAIEGTGAIAGRLLDPPAIPPRM